MRKIEVGIYNCPKCNADLFCTATDMYFMSKDVVKTRCNFKCLGCGTEFYSMELTGVGAPNSPVYICQYCEKRTEYIPLRDSWADYWKCVPCQVSFEQTWMSSRTGIDVINMYTNLQGNLYVLRQYLHSSKSRVELLPENLEDTVVIAQEFPYLLPTVNPANIREKLLTYLLFS